MPLASHELIRTREAAQRLLEHLGLEAYLFEVEPAAGDWRLRVECAATEGWRTTTLSLDKEDLIASAADIDAYRRLLEEWGVHLAECRKHPSA
jgi:hypothetical protein